MNKSLKPLIILGILMLFWSVIDIYDYISIGIDTLNHYLGTSNQEIINKLVNTQVRNGLLKAIIGVILIIIPFVRKIK